MVDMTGIRMAARRLRAGLAAVAVAGLAVGVQAGAAAASGPAVQPVATTSGLSSIICGGVKHGTGWKTYPTGGYVGQGCGAGIDYVTTPTSAT